MEWILGYACPLIGARPISEIAAPEVLAAIRPLEAAGKLDAARRLRSTIGGVVRYAIATARATNDPTLALHGAIASKDKNKVNRPRLPIRSRSADFCGRLTAFWDSRPP